MRAYFVLFWTRKKSDLRYFAFIFDGLCHIVDYRNGRLILIVLGPNSLLVVVLEREREWRRGYIWSSSIRAEQFSISSPWCCCWMFVGYCWGRGANRLTHIWWCKPFGVCWCWKLLARQHINSPASVAFCYIRIYVVLLYVFDDDDIHKHITEWDDDGTFRSRPPKSDKRLEQSRNHQIFAPLWTINLH